MSEYLYRPTVVVEPFGACIERCLIVKRTARHVVCLRVGELINDSGEPLHPNLVPDGKTRFVDRQMLEDHGYARPANSGLRLFLSFEGALLHRDSVKRPTAALAAALRPISRRSRRR
jgi:hypothetical protein